MQEEGCLVHTTAYAQGGCKGGIKGSPGPPNFWNEKKCVFNIRRRIKVWVSCCWRCSGTCLLVRHTWRCPCSSLVLEAKHKASWGPLKDVVSTQKAPKGFETETRELPGGPDEKSIFPTRGHWFYLSGPPNIWLLSTRLLIKPFSSPAYLLVILTVLFIKIIVVSIAVVVNSVGGGGGVLP